MISVKRLAHVTFETPDLERQIDYFTHIAGLVLAAREKGRAYLATKVGDLAVQLEEGSQARCARLAFQAAPDLELDALRRGIEAENLRYEMRNDPYPASPKCWHLRTRKAPFARCSRCSRRSPSISR